jgi:hypothetical protein
MTTDGVHQSAREWLVKAQQAGKGLAGTVVICKLWNAVITFSSELYQLIQYPVHTSSIDTPLKRDNIFKHYVANSETETLGVPFSKQFLDKEKKKDHLDRELFPRLTLRSFRHIIIIMNKEDLGIRNRASFSRSFSF